MQALSLWQPYASLIMRGFKHYEFRVWPPPPDIIGTRIAIHAAKRPMKMAELEEMIMQFGEGTDGALAGGLVPRTRIETNEWLRRVKIGQEQVPLGMVLGTVVVGQPLSGPLLNEALGLPVEIVPEKHDTDPLPPGRVMWGWPVLLPRPLARGPVPATGSRRLWEWTPSNPREADPI